MSSKHIDYINNSNIREDSLEIKKLHWNCKGNSVFANNLLKYLNVWLSSDTTGHNSLPKISKYSAKDNTVKEVKSQTHLSQIPINSNLLFNNDASDDNQTNTLKKADQWWSKQNKIEHLA